MVRPSQPTHLRRVSPHERAAYSLGTQRPLLVQPSRGKGEAGSGSGSFQTLKLTVLEMIRLRSKVLSGETDLGPFTSEFSPHEMGPLPSHHYLSQV